MVWRIIQNLHYNDKKGGCTIRKKKYYLFRRLNWETSFFWSLSICGENLTNTFAVLFYMLHWISENQPTHFTLYCSTYGFKSRMYQYYRKHYLRSIPGRSFSVNISVLTDMIVTFKVRVPFPDAINLHWDII